MKPIRVVLPSVFLITVSLFVCFLLVLAEENISKLIMFKAGTSSATVEDTLSGYDSIDYRLRARRGQTMDLSLQTDNLSNYFNVLPPGSEVAIYNSSVGGNTWSGGLPRDGEYTIRVYLMRNAARRNETAKFSLTAAINDSGDAKVAKSPYHATGTVLCSIATDPKESEKCSFGVIRKGLAEAEVHLAAAGFDVTLEKDDIRILKFSGDNVSTPKADSKVMAGKKDDNWLINIDDFYYYTIPDAVINGG